MYCPCLQVLTASQHVSCFVLPQGLARLDELVRKMLDIVDNRVVANLEAVQATLLVELPADR